MRREEIGTKEWLHVPTFAEVGHIIYCIHEKISGRELSERTSWPYTLSSMEYQSNGEFLDLMSLLHVGL